MAESAPAATVTPREAVRRLAEILCQEMTRFIEIPELWGDLPPERRVGFYDAILTLSDCECYWRVLFDNPDDDPVCGGVVDGE